MFCTISDMCSGGAWICSVLSVTCVVGGPGYVLYYQ